MTSHEEEEVYPPPLFGVSAAVAAAAARAEDLAVDPSSGGSDPREGSSTKRQPFSPELQVNESGMSWLLRQPTEVLTMTRESPALPGRSDSDASEEEEITSQGEPWLLIAEEDKEVLVENKHFLSSLSITPATNLDEMKKNGIQIVQHPSPKNRGGTCPGSANAGNWINPHSWPEKYLPRERNMALTFLEGVGPLELHVVDIPGAVEGYLDSMLLKEYALERTMAMRELKRREALQRYCTATKRGSCTGSGPGDSSSHQSSLFSPASAHASASLRKKKKKDVSHSIKWSAKKSKELLHTAVYYAHQVVVGAVKREAPEDKGNASRSEESTREKEHWKIYRMWGTRGQKGGGVHSGAGAGAGAGGGGGGGAECSGEEAEEDSTQRRLPSLVKRQVFTDPEMFLPSSHHPFLFVSEYIIAQVLHPTPTSS